MTTHLNFDPRFAFSMKNGRIEPCCDQMEELELYAANWDGTLGYVVTSESCDCPNRFLIYNWDELGHIQVDVRNNAPVPEAVPDYPFDDDYLDQKKWSDIFNMAGLSRDDLWVDSVSRGREEWQTTIYNAKKELPAEWGLYLVLMEVKNTYSWHICEFNNGGWVIVGNPPVTIVKWTFLPPKLPTVPNG